MDKGNFVYICREIIEPACGDHPAFLMGQEGERVQIIEVDNKKAFPYTVEGPTNLGKPWGARREDLMRTKPI